MITLENFVVQCKMPWGKDGEEILQYISQDAYYTQKLSEAKFFKSMKNANQSVSYHSRNNKFAHDFVILRVKRTFEITGIIENESCKETRKA
jgi:hypothetical protein